MLAPHEGGLDGEGLWVIVCEENVPVRVVQPRRLRRCAPVPHPPRAAQQARLDGLPGRLRVDAGELRVPAGAGGADPGESPPVEGHAEQDLVGRHAVRLIEAHGPGEVVARALRLRLRVARIGAERSVEAAVGAEDGVHVIGHDIEPVDVGHERGQIVAVCDRVRPALLPGTRRGRHGQQVVPMGSASQGIELPAQLAHQRRGIGPVLRARAVHAAVHRELPVQIDAVEVLPADQQPDAAAREAGTRSRRERDVGVLGRLIPAADRSQDLQTRMRSAQSAQCAHGPRLGRPRRRTRTAGGRLLESIDDVAEHARRDIRHRHAAVVIGSHLPARHGPRRHDRREHHEDQQPAQRRTRGRRDSR